jgi:hypothetical protein
LLASLYATHGADLEGLIVDGRRAGAVFQREGGHPVYTSDLTIRPGQTRTLVYHLTEPRTAGPVRTVVQPLVRPMTQQLAEPAC